MKFADFAVFISELELTASRNLMTEILARLIRKTEAEEVDKMVYLILGRLAPSYKNVVFNLAERMMLKVVSQAYSVEVKRVREMFKQKGDFGDVVEGLAQGAGEGLSVGGVYQKLYEIAQDEGEGSQERKISKMAELMVKLDPLGAKYIARIPLAKLRLGFSDKTVLDALSYLECGDKSAKKKLESAYNVLPDVGLLAKMVKQDGISKTTKNVTPTLGVPVLSMLAQRLKSPDEMIKKMKQVAVEPKLDGLRISLHYRKGGFVKAFTRNLNETAWMFPELESISKSLAAREVILDSEAVGIDRNLQAMVNFQTTMTRRRKHEIAAAAKKVQISFYVFDILMVDGKNLLNEPYKRRRQELERVVKEGGILKIVEHEITQDVERIRYLNKKFRGDGLEGIIVKKLDSAYVSGRTGWRWVKMKEAEEDSAKLADTLDCVVMGYTLGKGKRASFGVGQFLVGVLEGEKVKTVTKIGTGLTDEQFRELKQRLQKVEVEKKPEMFVVDKNLEPDYWVRPEIIVEVAADEITKSPNHTSGYALRFPRLIKFRDDKNPEQATSLKELIELYKSIRK